MSLDTDETLKILEDIKIPPAPHTLTKLHEELQKDEPLLMDIANIIAQDVGISALVLRTVNSAFFGLKAKAASIQHATSLLGMQNTVNIVAGLALRKAFDETDGANPPNYWDSPMNIAMVCADIARTISGVESDEAYMLGLFHNAGHALMMSYFKDYKEFLDQSLNQEGPVITELEDARYETDHAVLGYFLARSWGVDKPVAELIRDHHAVPDRLSLESASGKETLLCVLKMAEHIDKLFWGMDPDYEWLVIGDQVLDFVGLSKPDFEDLKTDMLEKLLNGEY